MEGRVSNLIRSDNFYFFLLGGLGFFFGTKACDFLFYNERKYLIIRESMEEEYWKVNGEPKHIKPDLVESFLHPG